MSSTRKTGMMVSIRWKCSALLVGLLLMLQFPVGALACATCGCSELCPVTMLDETTHNGAKQSLLSNSIWGNIILKMSYERDPELQRLRRMTKGVNVSTVSTLGAAAAGTLAQGTVSIVTLNPPDGQPDRYAPGIVGLVLEGATNLALWGRLGLNSALHRKIRARQFAIREMVEAILRHLEFSETNCPEAQKQLVELIGDKAASECIDLWRSSHTVTSALAAGG